MKRFFESDSFLRIASLFLALLIWFAIRQVTGYEETLYDITLEIEHGDGWAIEDVSSDSFQVAFQGSREDISRLKLENIRIEVDLREKEHTSNEIRLTPKNVIYPGAARVASITPNTIQIRLDQEIEKSVPVKPLYTGVLAPGCVKEAESVQPSVVTIRASAKQLEQINALQTNPIDLSGRSASFESRVAVLSPAGSWIKRIEPNRVLVLTTVTRHVVEKTFDDVTVLFPLGSNGNSSVTNVIPQVVSVRAEADEGRAELLIPESVEIIPETTATEDGLYPLRVRVPEGVRVLEIIPAKVTLQKLQDSSENSKKANP